MNRATRRNADARKVLGRPKSDSAGFSPALLDILQPLDELAEHSARLGSNRSSRFQFTGQALILPCYTFTGPEGGGDPLRIGLFGGIHGDEPEGPAALIQLVRLLEQSPMVAEGYRLSVYPVCNPTGLEDGTRESRNGKDLDREFWIGSRQPEVRHLEDELLANAFHGIIALHSDAGSTGMYGFVQGATLTEHLIEPALKAAEAFLPRNRAAVIEGFIAREGVVRNGHCGVLSAPPPARPRPFEIVLTVPQSAPGALKEAAFVAALQPILHNYRALVAYAPNL